jgi:hypothetical protein
MRTEIEDYIEEHIGTVSYVYHEIVSDKVHIDIHVVDPSEKRNSYTLITSGMSDQPMPAPSGREGYRYTELTLSLPASWPMSPDELQDQNAQDFYCVLLMHSCRDNLLSPTRYGRKPK